MKKIEIIVTKLENLEAQLIGYVTCEVDLKRDVIPNRLETYMAFF